MSELRNSTDSTISTFSPSRLETLIKTQRDYHASGKTLPLKARKSVLQRLLNLLEDEEDLILDALSNDLGKPPLEAWLSEIYFLRKELRLVLKRLSKWMKPTRVGHPPFLFPSKSHIQRDPLGLVLIMSPWNYPFQLALSPVIGALAAGNCVILKPSESAPATATALAEMIAQIAPPSHITVVTGGPELGEALLKQRFDHYFFTGGESIGRKVAAAAATHLSPCVLELGGKSPAIIDWSCNLPRAVDRIVAGKFFNGGQTCIAPDFVAVPDFLLSDFMIELEAAVDRAYGSTPMEIAHCPTIAHRDRLLNLIPKHARQIGDDEPKNLRLAPRWAVVDWDHPSMTEEVFGPFLPIISYPDREEFLEQLVKRPAPLALYLFSDSDSFTSEVIHKLPSGTVCINDVLKQAINLNLPFGGVRNSGHGRYRGRASFDTFSYERAVTRRYMIPDIFSISPPYGDRLKQLRKWLR
ncbi:MAG: aldehyde dehydrogenase family protein [Verrucomicrobiales bacterium]